MGTKYEPMGINFNIYAKPSNTIVQRRQFMSDQQIELTDHNKIAKNSTTQIINKERVGKKILTKAMNSLV